MKTFNEKGVNALYHSNEAARALLETLAAMPRQEETEIEAVERKLGKTHPEVNRREVVTLFKKLDEFGVGEFIPGRRGHPSRFRWEVDSVRVGQADTVNHTPVRDSGPATPQYSGETFQVPTVMISHHFQLRPDMVVTLQLPSNITSTEANRLGQFINSLPFHDDARISGAI